MDRVVLHDMVAHSAIKVWGLAAGLVDGNLGDAVCCPYPLT